MAYLTVPVCQTTEDKFIDEIKSVAVFGPNLLELRTDCIHNLTYDTLENLIKTAKSFSIPIIVTCRDSKEGGMHNHTALVRQEILCEAVRLGADYIDCEFINYQDPKFSQPLLNAMSLKPNCRLIISAHNFDAPFYQLKELYDNIHSANKTAIVKLAYKAITINDCFAAFDLLKERKSDVIIACMGQHGVLSRIIAPKVGNFITFASSASGMESAPGQVSIENMRSLYRWNSISEKTNLYGVIADPVGHSASPAVYNACFDASNFDGVYVPLLVNGDKQTFDAFMDNILSRPWLGFRGFSVTIPHKTNAFEYVCRNGKIDQKAKPIGAINTIAISQNGELSGSNTDYAGAITPLQAICNITGAKTAILGAGGVSRAVAAALTDNGAKVTIFNRTIEKAKELAGIFNCQFDSIANISRLKNDCFDIVINCTSLGMSPNIDKSPLPESCILPNMTVFDTVYNPIETKLLKDAAKEGAKTINGIEMFLEQAIEQYRILTESDADRKIIKEILTKRLTNS